MYIYMNTCMHIKIILHQQIYTTITTTERIHYHAELAMKVFMPARKTENSLH